MARRKSRPRGASRRIDQSQDQQIDKSNTSQRKGSLMPQQQWYLAIGGHQVGPIGEDEVVRSIQAGTVDGNTLVFTAGMSNWTALKDVPQLAAHLGGAAASGGAQVPAVPGRQSH